jgi:catechol 2,3-dioxygenase-like lactoylglutathione lyase family enzyme
MRFVNPIIFVRDIAASKAFYTDVIGLPIEQDHGDFVLFSGHFGIHAGTALIRTVWGTENAGEPASFGGQNLLLYFEDDDIDASFLRLKDRVRLIHPLDRQAWGQRVFRFYDPDGHAVEIGEPMT